MNVREIDVVSTEVALLVMDCILLDGYIARNDTFGAHDQKKVVEDRMSNMDATDISTAQYHYNLTSG